MILTGCNKPTMYDNVLCLIQPFMYVLRPCEPQVDQVMHLKHPWWSEQDALDFDQCSAAKCLKIVPIMSYLYFLHNESLLYYTYIYAISCCNKIVFNLWYHLPAWMYDSINYFIVSALQFNLFFWNSITFAPLSVLIKWKVSYQYWHFSFEGTRSSGS